MKESSVRALALIALITCTVFLALTLTVTPTFEESESIYGKGAKPTNSSTINQRAIIPSFLN